MKTVIQVKQNDIQKLTVEDVRDYGRKVLRSKKTALDCYKTITNKK